ncbi:hypothetical protein ACFSTD_21000 [Novosphingobium colocasiae]
MNIGMLWDENITADDDGTFEVTVSAKEQPGNWTPIPADLRGDTHIPEIYPAAGSFNIRRYDWDWDSDLAPGWLSIERVDEQAPAYPAALEAGQFAAQIENATRLFQGSRAVVEPARGRCACAQSRQRDNAAQHAPARREEL